MGDKIKGGVKNLKKWVTSFMDGPPYKENMMTHVRKKVNLQFPMNALHTKTNTICIVADNKKNPRNLKR